MSTDIAPGSDLAPARWLEGRWDDDLPQRGWDLLEVAAAWQRAGEHDRALQLLRDVVDAGGEDAEYAIVATADVLFELGRDDEAEAELRVFRRSRPRRAGSCMMAGELQEERGSNEQALRWFNIAVSRVGEDEFDHLAAGGGRFEAAFIATGRRRVREKLGMGEDRWDRLAASCSPFAGATAFPSSDEVLDSLPEHDRFPAVRTLFWPGREVAAAAARWPDSVAASEIPGYHGRMESRFREMSARGAPSITLVPGTVAGLEEFAGDAGVGAGIPDDATRRAYMQSLAARGHTREWPPPRNGPCWCGSETKYKRCCGRPAA